MMKGAPGVKVLCKTLALAILQVDTTQQAGQPHKSCSEEQGRDSTQSCPEEQGRDITQRLDRSIPTPASLLSTSPHRQLGLSSCNDLIPGLLEGLAMGLVLHLLLPLTAHILTLEGASSDAWLPPDPARRLQKNAEQVTHMSSSRLCSKVRVSAI